MTQQEMDKPEKKHAQGYQNQPQTVEEVAEWEPEQVWVEYETE
ncbi:MAG TPA: hypothetical protein VEX70_11700 [Pyrinomonadaceae bacterium]|jgi:hypothetical protein|nr:hypothetical protein [Pyrinomonadaceae bacterium]